MLRYAVLATAALALALGGIVAQADSEYPNRPVRLIAAAAPGGNPDVLARLLSQKLSGAFGKAFVVENVPGAGGVVAAKMVAATPPDGHVLMLGDSGAMAAVARTAIRTMTSASRYSGWMLAAFTSSPREVSPVLTMSASSSGVLVATATPSTPSFSFTASVFSTSRIAALRRAITGAGVAAGAKMPCHDDISNPGTVSPMVGTSGIA